MPDPCLPTYDSLTSLDEQLPHHDGGHEHRHEHAFQRPRVPRKVSKPLAIPSIPAKRSRQNTAMSTMSTNSSHASASQLCLPETLPILEQIQRDLDELLPRMKVEYYLNVDQLISWHQRDVQDRNMSEERQEEIRKRKANGEDLSEPPLVPYLALIIHCAHRGILQVIERGPHLCISSNSSRRPLARHTLPGIHLRRRVVPNRQVKFFDFIIY